MKATKKILALALTLVLVFALTATAFADAPTGKITLTNASAGNSYQLYKLFDATYNSETKTTAYSTSDATLAGVLEAVKDGDDPVFVVGTVDTAGNYSVSVAEGMPDKALDWIKTYAETYGTPVGSPKSITAGSSSSIIWEVPYGYYFIKNGAKTTLTIDSNTTDVTVIDKNTTEPVTPDPTPDDPSQTGAKSVDKASAKIGDTVTFTVQFTATNFVTKADEDGKVTSDQITKYVVKDTASSSLTLNEDIKVMIGDTELTTAAKKFDTNGELTLNWVDASTGNSLYASPVTVTITYTALVKKDILTTDATNAATISYYTKDAPTNPVVVNPEDDPVEIKWYEFDLTKTDKEENPLSGAEFKLYDASTNGNEIKVVACKADGTVAGGSDTIAYYRVAEAAETGVVITAGTATVKGLAAGTYYLEETKAPLGYNKLENRVAVTVAAAGTNSVTVQNAAGIELPSTGGEGTTLLIALGSVLFVATALVLVTKKRMYNEGC